MALTQISTEGIKNGTITGSDLATNIDLVDSQRIRIGTGNDLELYHDGTNSYIQDAGTGDLLVNTSQMRIKNAANNETMAIFTENGKVQLWYDNSAKFETTSTGTLTTGFADHRKDSTSTYSPTDFPSNVIARFFNESNTNNSHSSIQLGSRNNSGSPDIWYITCATQTSSFDADLAFTARTSSSAAQEVVRFTNDGNLQIPNDSGKLQLGASQDLEIFHDGNHSYIDNDTGHLTVTASQINLNNQDNSENCATLVGNGAVNLFFDGSKKFETKSDGIDVTGEVQCDSLDVDGGANISSVLTMQSYIQGTGTLNLYGSSSSSNGLALATNGNVTLQGDLDLQDDDKLLLGTGDDLQIYHDGSNSYLNNTGTGVLILQGNGSSDVSVRAVSGESGVVVKPNGGASLVELYYDNSKKFETTSYGARIFGNFENHNGFITVKDDGKFTVGNSDDLTIEHDGSNSRIRNITGQLQIRSNSIALENNDGSDYAAITGLKLLDNAKARFGSSNDLQIYHDGTNSYIKNLTGWLNIPVSNNGVSIANSDFSENIARFLKDGACELYNDGSKKLETTSTGVQVTGFITNTAMPRCQIVNPVDEALTGADNDVNVKFSTTEQNVGCTVNNNKDKITILTAGTYFVSTMLAGSKTGSGDSGDGIEIALRVNGGRFMGGSNSAPLDTFGHNNGDEFVFTYATYEDLSANDEISVTFSNIGDARATVKRGFLSLIRLG